MVIMVALPATRIRGPRFYSWKEKTKLQKRLLAPLLELSSMVVNSRCLLKL